MGDTLGLDSATGVGMGGAPGVTPPPGLAPADRKLPALPGVFIKPPLLLLGPSPGRRAPAGVLPPPPAAALPPGVVWGCAGGRAEASGVLCGTGGGAPGLRGLPEVEAPPAAAAAAVPLAWTTAAAAATASAGRGLHVQHVQHDRSVSAVLDGRTDGCTVGWMHSWMDGWMLSHGGDHNCLSRAHKKNGSMA